MASNDAVSPETLSRLHTALNPQKGGEAEQKAPDAAADAAKAAEAGTEGGSGGEDKARDDKGRFKPKEMSPAERGLLAAAKAEREKRKTLERELADIRAQLAKKPPETKAQADRREELLSKATEETRDFWKNIADPVVRDTIREEVQKVLGQYEPSLKAAETVYTTQTKEKEFISDLQEFVEDMALEGVAVDPRGLVDTLTRFEQEHDISLGSTNRRKFENAIGLMGSKPPQNSESAEDKRKAAQEEAEAKARAGGASPSATAGREPPDRAALGRSVREMAVKGDLRGVADILGKRIPKHPLLAGRNP